MGKGMAGVAIGDMLLIYHRRFSSTPNACESSVTSTLYDHLICFMKYTALLRQPTLPISFSSILFLTLFLNHVISFIRESIRELTFPKNFFVNKTKSYDLS